MENKIKNDEKYKKILIKMYDLSEKKYNEGKNNPPISAILYDSKNLEIIHYAVNNKNGIKNHAERLIIKKIIAGDIKNHTKKYNLIITCPPCSNCLNTLLEEDIFFNKIEWLTSLGKDEELRNLKNKKYKDILKISEIFLSSGEIEKLRLNASFRWIEYKFNQNKNNIIKSQK